MKKLFLGLLLLIVAVVAAAAIALISPPTGLVKRMLTERVQQATGLSLAIDGPMTLRLWPNVSARLASVTLTNPAAAGAQPLIKAEAVEISTALSPLLQGRRDIEDVRLIDPVIVLAFDKDGRSALPAAGAAPGASGGGAAPTIARLSFERARVDYRDQRQALAVKLDGLTGTANAVGAVRFADAAITSGNASVTIGADPATITLSSMSGGAKAFDGSKLGALKFDAGRLVVKGSGTTAPVTLDKATLSGTDIAAAGTGAAMLSGASLTWPASAERTLTMSDMTAKTASIAGGKLQGFDFTSAALGVAGSMGPRDSSTPFGLTKVTGKASTLSLDDAIDADIGATWNGEPLSGHARLPSPRNLAGASGAAIPASIKLSSAKADVDFTGDLMPGDATRLKGHAKGSAPSLPELAKWLGLGTPPTVAGAVALDGDVDATAQRIALSNGTIRHGPTVLTGSLDVDVSGPRPKIKGTISADKLDANAYLGIVPKPATRDLEPPQSVTPAVPVKDAIKAYLRAMLAAPAGAGDKITATVSLDDLTGDSRTRAIKPPQWSDEPIDLSRLRSVDLDLDLSVKTLHVQDLDIAVPYLKTQLADGKLDLDARDLATRGGKLTGKASIDTRQASPQVAATFTADNVEVRDIFSATGITVMLAGPSTVQADLKGNGTSQRQLAGSLTGSVKAQMRQGAVVGYDFSNIMSWLFGDRTYDSSRRTPFNRLDAAVAFDKGVARDSTVKLDGPVVGGDADGAIRLPEKAIDYHAKLRLSSFLSALAVRIFGEWERPSVTPDLDVFSRSPGGTVSPVVALAGVDLKDPELASLAGQVLDKAGSRGLDPTVADTLRWLQSKAGDQGSKR